VLYSDELSKIVKRACVHNEVRIRRALALERLGIRWAADIAKLDLYKTFKRFARLKEPNLAALGRRARGRSRAKSADIAYIGGEAFDLDVLQGEQLVDENLSRWARAPLIARAFQLACKQEQIEPHLVLSPVEWPALTRLVT
jgi:hypothetical protein